MKMNPVRRRVEAALLEALQAILPHAQTTFRRPLAPEMADLWEGSNGPSFVLSIENRERTLEPAVANASRLLGLPRECAPELGQELLSVIGSLLREGRAPQAADVSALLAAIETKFPVEQWRVVRPIYGVHLERGDAIHLGGVTVLCWATCKGVLEGHLSSGTQTESIGWSANATPTTVAEVLVHTRCSTAAIAEADKRYHALENALRFMAGSPVEAMSIGILDYHVRHRQHAIAVSPRLVSYNSAHKGGQFSRAIDAAIFHDAALGHDRVWALLESTSTSKLLRRVLSAVDWIGKAVHERDPADSLVQLVFSFETLFTYSEKGAFVTPSIASTIAEAAALVAGSTLAERVAIESEVKKLYGLRSDVAHGRGATITEADRVKGLSLCRRVVRAFLTHPVVGSLSSMESFRDWVRDQRYG